MVIYPWLNGVSHGNHLGRSTPPFTRAYPGNHSPGCVRTTIHLSVSRQPITWACSHHHSKTGCNTVWVLDADGSPWRSQGWLMRCEMMRVCGCCVMFNRTSSTWILRRTQDLSYLPPKLVLFSLDPQSNLRIHRLFFLSPRNRLRPWTLTTVFISETEDSRRQAGRQLLHQCEKFPFLDT